MPDGWFVGAGTYQLAGGGKLSVSYKGPGGATIDVSQGAFCTDSSGCVPAGTEAGETPFGPWTGTLTNLADGGFAIVYARGEPISWLFVAHGIDDPTVRALAAAMVEVAE